MTLVILKSLLSDLNQCKKDSVQTPNTERPNQTKLRKRMKEKLRKVYMS